MASTPVQNVGSIEASAAMVSTTAGGNAAVMDYDPGTTTARFGAKGLAGANILVKIRTLLAGALVDALTFAASGAAAFAKAVTINTGGLTTLSGGGVTSGGPISAAGAISATGVIRNDANTAGFAMGPAANARRIVWDPIREAFGFVDDANAQASVEVLSVFALGNLLVSGHATPATGTQLSLGADVSTTAAAGSNGALPAQVVGYLVGYRGTQKIGIPYYLVT